jgi:hypothetical protein
VGSIGGWALKGLIVGAIAGAIVIVPEIRTRIEVPNSPLKAREILSRFIPAEAKFSSQMNP